MIRPYRFDLLPRVSRERIALARQLRAQLGPAAREALARWTTKYLGAVEEELDVRVAELQQRTPVDFVRLRAGSYLAIGLLGPSAQRGVLLLDAKLGAVLRAVLLQSEPAPLVAPASSAEQGLLLYALAGLAHELGPDCPWSVEPAPVEEGVGWLTVELAVTLRRLRGSAWLCLPEALLLRPVPAPSRPRHLARLSGVAWTLPVEIGRVQLPAAELGLLSEGDVVVSTSCPRAAEAYEGLLRVQRGGFPLRISGGQVTITGPYRQGGLGMSSTETESTARTGSPLVADLPVELVLELGRLQLSGAQVLELEVGDVLALNRPLALPVDVRVGERLLGRGELVDVDGEAGVRLVEVYD